jgi:lysophospholipase L1-like esterase
MKICVTGDSIAHGIDFGIRKPRTIGDFLTYQLKKSVVRDICYPSDGIALQTIRWNQISSNEKLEFDYIISMNGNNDMNKDTVVSTLMATYRTFFNTIRSQTKAGCKIIMLTMIPAYSTYAVASGNAAAWVAKRSEINTALHNEGVNAFSGMDAYINEHSVYMDDGAGTLKSIYYMSTGDKLHLSEAGRECIADFIVQKMKSLNWK